MADDIALKRRNIAKNFTAWLKSPHLGMVSILTAGDKHFFRIARQIEDEGLSDSEIDALKRLAVGGHAARRLGERSRRAADQQRRGGGGAREAGS